MMSSSFSIFSIAFYLLSSGFETVGFIQRGSSVARLRRVSRPALTVHRRLHPARSPSANGATQTTAPDTPRPFDPVRGTTARSPDRPHSHLRPDRERSRAAAPGGHWRHRG